jgi:hypothetical protein
VEQSSKSLHCCCCCFSEIYSCWMAVECPDAILLELHMLLLLLLLQCHHCHHLFSR